MNSPIFITGAGKRIGLHIAQRFLQDDYQVIIHYHTLTDAVKKIKSLGIKTIQGELDTKEGVISVIEGVQLLTTELRAIIHNASIYHRTDRKVEKSILQFERFFRIHMLAPYLINECLHHLLLNSSNKPTDIIHLTDIYAERPNPAYDIYCSTKAGLQSLTKSFAKRFAPQIKVNAIAPGPILFREEHTDKQKKAILSKTPLAFEGGAEAIYLAIRAIMENHYLSGISLPVDGGRSLSE